MPIGSYFKGNGEEVLASMRKKYGAKKAARVFYATANKHQEMKPSGMAETIAEQKRAGHFSKGARHQS